MTIERIFELAYMGTELLVNGAMNTAFDATLHEEERTSARLNLEMAANEQSEIMKIMSENGFEIPGLQKNMDERGE